MKTKQHMLNKTIDDEPVGGYVCVLRIIIAFF
jgi:hypothetical protein